ncbi:hypothetical protein F8568_034720 [Actinomadura sp. LD22]|uniref:Methyltransferase n=1 Tax=Actinomadura physcomitrii TaxID=2650748 RepID=A0A6I4MKJ7_9ACTN|nr:class I SAM-dependent methyltransferase [Actinomadura physcomitrii]MWA05430.1 hypothetical protein [Actinomadura physcomitrii]
MTNKLAPTPLDSRASAVVERLHARSRRQTRRALAPLLVHSVKSRIRTGTWDPTQNADTKAWLADKLVALDPHKAELCYLLCRSLGARRVVEAGTSFGVSTIYLASAIRDNVAGGPGDGLVIGTEHEPGKAAAARRNLDDAGVGEYAEIREGDLRDTLKDLDAPVDFMLVDIWIPLALPALELVVPKLRPGAIVMCDNVVSGHKQYASYLEYVRSPTGPFTSVTLPGHGGVELSMKK